MHRRDPLKRQSPSAEKAQQGSLPPETRRRECLLPGEGSGPHHPAPRQDQHLLPRLPSPRLRYPQHPTRQLPGQERLTLSVDPSSGIALTRSISRSSTSRVVGSAQCASSNNSTLGCRRAAASVISTRVRSVSSLCRCGVMVSTP